MNNFSETLKLLRQKKGMSQEELASYIGLERQTISAYENASREPSIDTLTKIAAYLNVSIDTLIKGVNDQATEEKVKAVNTFMTQKEIMNHYSVGAKDMCSGFPLGIFGKSAQIPMEADIPNGSSDASKILIVGAAGTGKTRLMKREILRAMENGESVVIHDATETFYSTMGKLFENNGYEVKVINFRNPYRSDVWNPLVEIINKWNHPNMQIAITAIKTAEFMADSLIEKSPAASRLYKELRAQLKDYLTALILIVSLTDKTLKDMKNLPFLYNMMNVADEEWITKLVNGRSRCAAAKDHWDRYLSANGGDAETRRDIRAYAKNVLKPLDSLSLSYFLSVSEENCSNIDPIALRRRKCAYFVITNPSVVNQPFATLFMELCLNSVMNSGPFRRREDVPVAFFFDEFTNMGKLSNFKDVICLKERAVSGIRLIAAAQNLETIKKMYGEELFDRDYASKVLWKFDTIISFKLYVDESIELLRELADYRFSTQFIKEMSEENLLCFHPGRCDKMLPLLLTKFDSDPAILKDAERLDIENYSPLWRMPYLF